MSISSRNLKPEHLPHLAEAADKAREMEYGPWIQWMRDRHRYSLCVRMSTFLGIKTPGRAFYETIRAYKTEIAA